MNRSHSALAAIVLALSAGGPLVADASSPKPADRGSKTMSHEDSERGFSASLQIASAAETDRFLEVWASSPPEHGPSLTTIDTAKRGDIVSTMLFYSGCANDQPEGSECPARLDLRVIAPDGSNYGDAPDLSLAQNQPTSARGVQLSPASLAIRFEPHDPLGVYRVQATIRDPQREITLELETSIELKADGAKE